MASKVTIICRNPGMRRNGVIHPASQTYPAGKWTEAQLEAFRADPNFEVIDGDAPVSKAASALQAQVADLTAKLADAQKAADDAGTLLAEMTAERDGLLTDKTTLQEALDKANADLKAAQEANPRNNRERP